MNQHIDRFEARTGDWRTPDGQTVFVNEAAPTGTGTVRLTGWSDGCPVGTCHGDHIGTPFTVEIPEADFENNTGGWLGPIG